MNNFNFLPFENLTSERLILRQITTADVSEIFALRSNPDTMKYIPRPLITTKEEAIEHINMIQDKIENNEGINWAITLKGSDKMIGIIGHYRVQWEHFRSEVGYMLLPKYEKRGIITEAVGLSIDYGFNSMKMHSLEAVVDPQNGASIKVLEKNGFAKEAHLKEAEFYNGKFIDRVIYSLLKNS
jgi:[ribosomal protein S5]-alanine N-acetyltransferase